MGTQQLKHAQIHIKDYGTVYTENKIDHVTRTKHNICPIREETQDLKRYCQVL